MSASFPNVVLNSIMAQTLNEFADALEGLKYLQDIREKALELCREIITKHNRILFSGDGYSKEWVEEAKRRGLANIPSYIEAIAILDDTKTSDLFNHLNVYTESELEANKQILTDQYCKDISIEVKTLLDICRREILPSMSAEWEFLSKCNTGKKCPSYIQNKQDELGSLIDELAASITTLESKFQDVSKIASLYEKGLELHHTICPLMVKTRTIIDAYEAIASKSYYTIPTYEEMWFKL